MSRSNPVLVTGAAGFGGSHLVEHLLACGHPVVALDQPGAPPENLAAVPRPHRVRELRPRRERPRRRP